MKAELILSVTSPILKSSVRKGSAVNEFFGWLIEKMAEVGTWYVAMMCTVRHDH